QTLWRSADTRDAASEQVELRAHAVVHNRRHLAALTQTWTAQRLGLRGLDCGLNQLSRELQAQLLGQLQRDSLRELRMVARGSEQTKHPVVGRHGHCCDVTKASKSCQLLRKTRSSRRSSIRTNRL